MKLRGRQALIIAGFVSAIQIDSEQEHNAKQEDPPFPSLPFLLHVFLRFLPWRCPSFVQDSSYVENSLLQPASQAGDTAQALLIVGKGNAREQLRKQPWDTPQAWQASPKHPCSAAGVQPQGHPRRLGTSTATCIRVTDHSWRLEIFYFHSTAFSD